MPDFRRGAAAVQESLDRAKSGGGSFRKFTPSIFWKNDGDEKYLLFLNEMEAIPKVDLIGFIPVQGKKGNGDKFEYFEQVIARTDPAIDEDEDPMAEEWGARPRENHVAVAVELEPTFTTVKGRKRPSGFEVKTTEFERRIRDDDGELTDETEDVTAPVVGFVTQSPHNFFNVVTSYDANDGPIHETPLKITRVGSDNSTTYTVQGYPEQELDLSALSEFVDGISYIDDDDLDGLIEEIDEAEDHEAAAHIIGAYLLDKRLEELCDLERYEELLEGIDRPFKFGDKDKGKKGEKKSSRSSSRRERPARRTQRRTEVAEAMGVEEEDPEPEADEPEEEKPKPKRTRATRTRAKKADPEPEAGSEDPEPEPEEEETKPKPKTRRGATPDERKGKLADLRERAAKQKAARAS